MWFPHIFFFAYGMFPFDLEHIVVQVQEYQITEMQISSVFSNVVEFLVNNGTL